MTHLSKRLADAVAAVSVLPADQQNVIAAEMTDRARLFSQPATKLNEQERVELEQELAAARRGEWASDDQVAALFAKYGL